MKNYLPFYLLIVSSFFFAGSAAAQNKTDSLDILLNAQPSYENIHLHTDKDIYLAGETIWFKAYILSNGGITTTSKNLFTELWSANGERISVFTSPIIDGTSFGQFALPDSLKEDRELIIRCLTRPMLALDPSQLYTKRIRVLGDHSTKTMNTVAKASLQLFAEGGTFIDNVPNIVSFKAVTSNGLPFTLAGAITDGTGKFIDSIKAEHDGMGSFVFFPVPGETYYVDWKDGEKNIQRTAFPLSAEAGITLSARQNKKEISYNVQNPFPKDDLSALSLVATMRQQIVYSSRIDYSKGKVFSGTIPVASLPAGIMQLTVFNKYMQPLAERIIFINKKDDILNSTINIIEKNTGKRGKNIIEIGLQDTLGKSLSIAVCDAKLSADNDNNIFTDLLLTGDVKGMVHKPGQYFSDTSEKMAGYLDLVMQTNGWRKYDWKDIIAGTGKEPVADSLLYYAGTVSDEMNNTVPNAMLSMIMRTKDSSGGLDVITADENGRFRQADLIVHDSASLFYNVMIPKKGKYKVRIITGTGLVPPAVPFSYRFGEGNALPKTDIQSVIEAIKTPWPGEAGQNIKVLQEVVVTARGHLEQMDNKYATLYKGWAGGRMYDYMNNSSARQTADPIKYMFTWMLPSHFLYPTVRIYIDEILVSPPALRSLTARSIAFVKYIPSDFQAPFTSAVYIYTKKDDDYLSEDEQKFNTKFSKIKFAGYTPVKEFYHPDYSGADSLLFPKKDIQTTVYWNPNIVMDKETNQYKITFYNNDVSTRLKIVLEGINEAGQLTRTEKWIE